jgi:hypothetical protein
MAPIEFFNNLLVLRPGGSSSEHRIGCRRITLSGASKGKP